MNKLISTLIFFPCIVFGQEVEVRRIPFVKISDLFVQNEFGRTASLDMNFNEVLKLTPNSTILKQNFTEFGTLMNSGSNNLRSNSIMLGLQFRNRNKTGFHINRLLRIGMGSTSQELNSFYMSREQRFVYDTLVSASTGATVYKDSIINENVGSRYSSKNISFNVSMIFRTQPKRWIFYTGVGINTSFSYSASSEVTFNRLKSTDEMNNYNNQNLSFNSNQSTLRETEKGKSNYSFNVFIPLGVNFQIGKKREFWKHFHLYYEFNPSLNYTEIKGIKGKMNMNLPMAFGLRYSI